MLRPNREMPIERTIGARQLLAVLFLFMAAMVYVSYLYAVRTEKSRTQAAAQQSESAEPETGPNQLRSPNNE